MEGDVTVVRNHTLLKQVGAKIAYFRALRGITQEELASKVSVNKSVISRIERGQYNENVGIIMLWSIANALNIDMKMLVTFTDFEKAMWENNYQDDIGTEKRL